MKDIINKQPIYVSTDGEASPCIIVPYQQLDEVTAILDANQVSYWVDEEVLSTDGQPEVAFVNLHRSSDAGKIQRLLDSIP